MADELQENIVITWNDSSVDAGVSRFKKWMADLDSVGDKTIAQIEKVESKVRQITLGGSGYDAVAEARRRISERAFVPSALPPVAERAMRNYAPGGGNVLTPGSYQHGFIPKVAEETGQQSRLAAFLAGRAAMENAPAAGGIGALGIGGAALGGSAVAEGFGKLVNLAHDARENVRKLDWQYAQLQQRFNEELHFAGLKELPHIAAQAAASLPKIANELDTLAHKQNLFWSPSTIASKALNFVAGGETDDEKNKRLQQEDLDKRAQIGQVMAKQAMLGRDELRVSELRVAGKYKEAEALQDQLDLTQEIARIRAEGLHGTGTVAPTRELIDQARKQIEFKRAEQKREGDEKEQADKDAKLSDVQSRTTDEYKHSAEMAQRLLSPEIQLNAVIEERAALLVKLSGLKQNTMERAVTELALAKKDTEASQLQRQIDEDKGRKQAAYASAQYDSAQAAERLRVSGLSYAEHLADLKRQQDEDVGKYKTSTPGLAQEELKKRMIDRQLQINPMEAEMNKTGPDWKAAFSPEDFDSLSHREKKSYRNKIMSAGQPGSDRDARLGLLGFSPTEVASGDARRRKAAEKEEARKKAGRLTEGEALMAVASAANATAENTAALAEAFGKKGKTGAHN